MFKFLFKLKLLGFVEAPVGVFLIMMDFWKPKSKKNAEKDKFLFTFEGCSKMLPMIGRPISP